LAAALDERPSRPGRELLKLLKADGALAPQLMLAFEWAPKLFDRPSPENDLPKLSAYWKAIVRDPIAARVMRETREAIETAQARVPRERQI